METRVLNGTNDFRFILRTVGCSSSEENSYAVWTSSPPCAASPPPLCSSDVLGPSPPASSYQETNIWFRQMKPPPACIMSNVLNRFSESVTENVFSPSTVRPPVHTGELNVSEQIIWIIICQTSDHLVFSTASATLKG